MELILNFVQLMAVVPGNFVNKTINVDHDQPYPSRGCAAVIHEHLDIFGVSCALPDSCGSKVSKIKLKRGILNEYILCQRMPRSVDLQRLQISYNWEMQMPFPGAHQLLNGDDVAFSKLNFLIYPDRTILEGFVTGAHYPGFLSATDICWSDEGKYEVFSYSRMPHAAYAWMTVSRLDLSTIRLPYNYRLLSRPYIIINDSAMSTSPACDEGFILWKASIFKIYAGNYDSKHAISCLNKRCMIDGEMFMRDDDYFSVKVKHGGWEINNISFTKITTYFCKPLVDCPHIVNTNKLCGLYDLVSYPYGQPMIINETHVIDKDKIIPIVPNYLCNEILPIYNDYLGIINVIRWIEKLVVNIISGLASLIIFILSDLFINLRGLIRAILEFIVELIQIMITTIFHLLEELELINSFFIYICTFLLIYLSERNLYFSVLLTIMFGLMLYIISPAFEEF